MNLLVGLLILGVGVLAGVLVMLLLAAPSAKPPVDSHRPTSPRSALPRRQPAPSGSPTPAARFDPLVIENDALREQLEVAAQKLATAEAERNAIQENLYRVGERLEALEAENEALRQELATAQAQRAPALLEAPTMVEREPADVQIDDLKAQINGLLRQLTETQSLRKQLTAVKQELATVQDELARLRAQLTIQSQAKQTLLQKKVNLEAIQGIGSTYARRLREAGIRTLSDLAQQTPEQVRQIVGLKAWQGGDPAQWIAEARALVAEDVPPDIPPPLSNMSVALDAPVDPPPTTPPSPADQ